MVVTQLTTPSRAGWSLEAAVIVADGPDAIAVAGEHEYAK